MVLVDFKRNTGGNARASRVTLTLSGGIEALSAHNRCDYHKDTQKCMNTSAEKPGDGK